MLSGIENRIQASSQQAFHDSDVPSIGFRLPRLLLFLLVLALPLFFIISADYFELLERSGPVGAVIADMVLPVMIVGYLALLLFLLKKSRI